VTAVTARSAVAGKIRSVGNRNCGTISCLEEDHG